jgi:hypothetical protein
VKAQLAAALGLVCAGCGYVGAPLPPSLDMPVAVTDLRAAEEGDQIRVEFTISDKTTEGLPLNSLRSVELTAGTQSFSVPVTAPGAASFMVPARPWIGSDVALRVRATGPKGKTSDWSNQVALAVIAPLAAPEGVQVSSTKQGVTVSWRGAGPKYRIFRATGDAAPEQAGESEIPSFLDESAQYGSTYRYYVMALAAETQRSAVSAPSQAITPVDIFAPEAPASVTAVAGVNSVEVAWERNTETDFKGYNVYRSVGDGMFEKVASLIGAPTFSDTRAEAGKTYRYAISAVDVSGNESGRSEPVSVALP